MNRISILLHSITLIAVAVLSFLVLSGPDEGASTLDAVEPITADSPQEMASAGSAVIAYVNTDTVLEQYQLAVTLRDKLNSQRIRFEQQLESGQRQLMSEADELRSRAATMSQFEAQQRQKDILEKEQRLLQLEEELSIQLVQLEQDYSQQINQQLESYLEKYAANKPFEVILSHNKVGAILWGQPGSDITREVVSGLNAAYQSQQATGAGN